MKRTLPHDSRRIIHEFLTLPQVDRILPGIATAPYACICAPRMTVGTAASPFGDRFAVIGDAVGSRLNKDGLYSAQVTASGLAHAVLHEGIDRQALAREYGKTVRWLVDDNRSGRIVFAVSRAAFAVPVISRIMYQAFATEYKVRDERSRPLSGLLWKIASGTADYREVLREMLSWGVLRSILAGAVITLRNVAVELFLGMKWGEYGRYPAVVPKEKRQALKEKLASSLEMELDPSPDFEKMYEIKIRGSEIEIMEQLAKYGQPGARFVKLRFFRMRQIHGTPNEVGSVIRYRVPFLRLGAELKLTKKVRLETLLYQADERLVDHGKTHLQHGADQGRKSQALHLRGVRLQEREESRGPDDVEGRQIPIPRVRARRGVEPCSVHNEGRCRAGAPSRAESRPCAAKCPRLRFYSKTRDAVTRSRCT